MSDIVPLFATVQTKNAPCCKFYIRALFSFDEETIKWRINICDIDGPVLDFADENTLIFHHYFGLFVYDISQNRLDSTLSLKELGCLNEQNELDCEIFVPKDGHEVYLHPTEKKKCTFMMSWRKH